VVQNEEGVRDDKLNMADTAGRIVGLLGANPASILFFVLAPTWI